VARKCERGDRDEWRFKHDRANRQDPNLMFCLTVHHILALEAMDRSRPIGKTAPWNSPAMPRIAWSGRRFVSTTGADLGGPADDPPERHTAGPLPASMKANGPYPKCQLYPHVPAMDGGKVWRA